MTIRYTRGRSTACYDTINPPMFAERPAPQPKGPFESCGDCPYASHGFMCYGKEGDCLKTDMEKISRREKSQCLS